MYTQNQHQGEEGHLLERNHHWITSGIRQGRKSKNNIKSIEYAWDVLRGVII
jgi:hypothetical protein